MRRWGKFNTYKERGEWVELEFTATAASHGYHVLKPWGDSLSYDVAIEHDGDLTRVQVKGSSSRHGTGYSCQFRREHDSHHRPYSLKELDIFATYVIPVDTWYLIPAAIILTPPIKQAINVYPVDTLLRDHYKYEHYREAWGLLGKSRKDLSRRNQRKK